MRVVIDTNVLLAASLNRSGRPAQSVRVVLQQETLVLSPLLLEELIQILDRPYFAARVDALSRAAYPVELAHFADLVIPTETIRVCRDPKDNQFLEAAVAGAAEFIVTGDADLLSLDPFRGIRIVNPAAFLALQAPPAA